MQLTKFEMRMEIVLNSYGVSLKRENNGFIITNQDGRKRVSPDGITSIVVCKSASVTSDAILLAIENDIDIVFTDKTGNVKGRVWTHKYGSISTIRKGQLNFCKSHDALLWIREILSQKIEAQLGVLKWSGYYCPIAQIESIRNTMTRLKKLQYKLRIVNGENVHSVAAMMRALEGSASKYYFKGLNSVLPTKYKFNGRTQHPAKDIFNALLNYGYGILYGRIEKALIKAGIDPYMGVLHRDEYNRPVFVYDVIERFRCWIDVVVINLLCTYGVTDHCCSFQTDGNCFLEDDGRKILIQAVNVYLGELVEYDGLSRSRSSHIDLFAQEIAKMLKRYNDKY